MNAIPSSVSQEPLTACHEGEMRRVLRALHAASGLSMRMLDELAGLPIGYVEKCLCEPPLRNLGPTSFFPLLGALSHKLAFVPDPDSRVKANSFYQLKNRSQDRGGKLHWRAVERSDAVVIELSRDFFREIGAKGGKNSRKNLGKRKVRQLAKKAAAASVNKRRTNEQAKRARQRRATHKARKRG